VEQLLIPEIHNENDFPQVCGKISDPENIFPAIAGKINDREKRGRPKEHILLTIKNDFFNHSLKKNKTNLKTRIY
jgi:hypothetical protein